MIKPLDNIIKYYPKVTVTLIALLLCNPLDAATSILRDKVTKTGIKIELGVDLNRDGEITFDSYTDGKLNPNDDKTSPQRPFRFWLNNDFDAVNFKGDDILTRKTCDAADGGANIKFEGQDEGKIQVCEQDDFTTGSNASTPNIIEAVRDLEDFAPLAIKISPWNPGLQDVKIKLRGNSFGIINLFEGKWTSVKNATEYLTNNAKAIDQVKNENFIASLRDQTLAIPGGFNPNNKPYVVDINANSLDLNEEGSGIAKFIFEGFSNNLIKNCEQTPEQCYLELIVEDKNKNIVASEKLYLQLNDIKKYYTHYTVGQFYDHGPDGANKPASGQIVVPDETPSQVNSKQQNVIVAKDAEKQTINNNDYILFVHGWRMKPPERVIFAETTFKRLYWAGYKGNFGLFSWPTGWFERKPYLVANPVLAVNPETGYLAVRNLLKAFDDPQNYDRSEAIGRRAGQRLALLMEALNALHTNVRVLAHSMGNVVVSEALKTYTAGPTALSHYAAAQTAEVGHAYNPNLDNFTVNVPLLPEALGGGENRDFVDAYRGLNPTADANLIPTNRYANALTPAGTEYNYNDPELKQAYYQGIKAKVASAIINFHNKDDAALDAWKLNQATKPDDGLRLARSTIPISIAQILLDLVPLPLDTQWQEQKERTNCPTIPDPEQPLMTICNPALQAGEPLIDRYFADPTILGSPQEIDFDSQPIDQYNQFDILAHIIPGRSDPLGAIGVKGINTEVTSAIDMNLEGANASKFGYTRFNYDHSAEFLSDYPARKCFWSNLLLAYGILDLSKPSDLKIFPLDCVLSN